MPFSPISRLLHEKMAEFVQHVTLLACTTAAGACAPREPNARAIRQKIECQEHGQKPLDVADTRAGGCNHQK